MMGINVEISDNELFELLGKKDCEIAMNEKTIEAFKAQMEKVKALIIELETLKKAKIDLEASNKSLSETNIKLDQALTVVRKERDAFKTEIEVKRLELARKISELENLTAERDSYKLQWEEISTKLDKSKETNVNHRKGKKRTASINPNG
jgi:chromosome segregation ATPase